MSFKKTTLRLADTKQFSKLVIHYINGEEKLRKFYSYKPSIDSFKQAIEDKSKENINRKLLVEVITEQYKKSNISIPSAQISILENENTFTVCTGHQLCLFTGPLYFIYKIITTINLAEELKKQYADYNFVPVYWMASEDHDFDEIKSINLFGQKLMWDNPTAKGAVGRLKTDELKVTIDEFKKILGESSNANELTKLFSEAYLNHPNLAVATRYLVHSLFADSDLVILDADDARLKSEFLEIIKDDISNRTNYKIVNKTIEELKQAGYDAQVNPREINLFQLTDNDRWRIEKPTDETLNLKPESYSPNVVLRPLYQQKILPNLAYVGGPGEIAYWMEYRAMFNHHKINFPVLIPRNFAMMIDEKSEQQMNKLGITISDLFKDTEVLIKEFITRNSTIDISLKDEEDKLVAAFNVIMEKAVKFDVTLKGAVEAEMQKALNSLKNIEGKLVKAEKQKQETTVNQIKKLKDKFFPGGMLQERHDNFAPYYLKSGKQLIGDLKEQFNPFEFEMMILSN